MHKSQTGMKTQVVWELPYYAAFIMTFCFIKEQCDLSESTTQRAVDQQHSLKEKKKNNNNTEGCWWAGSRADTEGGSRSHWPKGSRSHVLESIPYSFPDYGFDSRIRELFAQGKVLSIHEQLQQEMTIING